MNNVDRKYLRFPAPYFGAKTKIAKAVWRRFGNPDTYIEPFCGSCGVFWKRPLEHFSDGKSRSEILNDKDGYLVNFLRAVNLSPQMTAGSTTWPVTELDLIARYQYLAFGSEKLSILKGLKKDPNFFDTVTAGWWIWGMACWIGSDGFSQMSGDNWNKIPELQSEKGCTKPARVKVVGEKWDRLQWLKTIEFQTAKVERWFKVLSNRLQHTRITCGDWQRVVNSPNLLRGPQAGKVAIFLDPPYPTIYEGGEKSARVVYAKGDGDKLVQVQKDVYTFCRKNSDLRIAVCGYAGDGYEKLVTKHGWSEMKWKTTGGYANTGGKGHESLGKSNAKRERIWFSPSCLKPSTLF